MFDQLSWWFFCIFNSCVKNVPLKQLTIVLEKCFSKCLAGASNADRGNPVYSQDKSAPAWPIHTPSSTAPYIQNTKKTQLKYRKIQKAKIIWLLAPSILNIPCFGSPNLCFIFVIRDASLYQKYSFFNIVQKPFDPPPAPFVWTLCGEFFWRNFNKSA